MISAAIDKTFPLIVPQRANSRKLPVWWKVCEHCRNVRYVPVMECKQFASIRNRGNPGEFLGIYYASVVFREVNMISRTD